MERVGAVIMHMKRNIIVVFIGICIVCAALIGIYWWMYVRIDYAAIDYIKSMQRGANNFSDLAGDIGVTDINDLGFEVKGKFDILIHYGKQVIRCNKNCLNSKEWKQKAKAIGIEVKFRINKDESIDYRVTYWGEPIQEWSLVT
ncbi:MAG: hypothetical protein NC548_11195 [Lachnospiraceae bacterium]|nr:hypothetical protein [Lachnospiraceae bacterium]